jgi:DNA-binding NtrC family response regulator
MLKNNENGLDGIRLIRKEDTDVPIIMITDFSSIETAIKAVKLGAFEYLPKSIRISELKLIIEKALELRYLKIRNESIEEEISSSFKEIVGESGVIKKLKEKIDLFASNDSTILVTGESGVGKELVTRQIHLNSDRKTEPFIVVNCAAIPPDLIESELFGHEKGAFTSADKKKNREV